MRVVGDIPLCFFVCTQRIHRREVRAWGSSQTLAMLSVYTQCSRTCAAGNSLQQNHCLQSWAPCILLDRSVFPGCQRRGQAGAVRWEV